MSTHLITREISIDAGHRVTYHGSKCRNVHGHRYRIEAMVKGPLYEHGEQKGMVLDFGFLKEEMMLEIDEPCDHGMIFWRDDELLARMFEPRLDDVGALHGGTLSLNEWWTHVDQILALNGFYAGHGRGEQKLYIVPFVPTAENLARHWFVRLDAAVGTRTRGQATMHSVRVWETPNCSAVYPG